MLIDDDAVTGSLSAVEKLEALHGDVTVPRSAIAGARVVVNGMVEFHGCVRPPAPAFWGDHCGDAARPRRRGLRGLSRRASRRHARSSRRAYDRIVVTVDDPEGAVRWLAP